MNRTGTSLDRKAYEDLAMALLEELTRQGAILVRGTIDLSLLVNIIERFAKEPQPSTNKPPDLGISVSDGLGVGDVFGSSR